MTATEMLTIGGKSSTPSGSASAPDEQPTSAVLDQASQAERLSGWRLFAVQTVLCLGLLLSVMESSIVATALLTIGEELGNFSEVIWVVLSYLLSYMGLSVVFARLSDVTGRKWATLSAWFIFSIFSLACGFSTSLTQLIAFRALQGVGGSGLYTLTMVVVPEISPPKLFAIMSACAGAVFSISAVLGPVLGGVITQRSTWRWIFWLNAPLGLASIIVLLFSWPGQIKSTVKKVKLAQVDWLGAVLLIAACILLITGLQQAGSAVFAWSSAASIATLTLSGVCWILLAAWLTFLDRRHLSGKTIVDGILPLSVVLRGRMFVVVATTLLTGFPFLLVLIYLPERYQVVQLEKPIRAGVDILPFLCSTGLGSAIGGGVSTRKNNTFWTLTVGCALLVLGCGLLSTAQLSLTIPAREYGYQVILGVGIGMVLATATIMCSLESKFKDLAVAQGIVAQARVLGGSIALATATIIFNNIAVSELSSVLTAEELQQLQHNPEAAYSFSLTDQLAVREVFAQSFHRELLVCTYVVAAAFVISFFAYSRNPVNTLERKVAHDAYLDGRLEDDA